MRTLNLSFFLFALFLTACNNSSNTAEGTETPAQETMESSQKYKLTPFSNSTMYQGATLQLGSYENGTFDFKVSGAGYELGQQTPDAPQKMCANSAKGQHIHLIIDNEPYSAQYTSNFDYDIADGEHYLLAFLSRSYHESIKSPGASVLKKVTVENKSITTSADVAEPMIFYSRPKGTYVGKNETEKVMLDYYLANVNPTMNYKVKADINGEEHMLDYWRPYYIEGLPMGRNKIKLTLVDENGKAVETPLNPVTREFMLQPDPTEGQ